METRSPKSNLPELLRLSRLPATLIMIRSKMNALAWRHHFTIKMKPLLSAQHFPGLWDTQGQVSIMQIVEPGPKSNLSEILCLSSLSAC